MDGVDRVQGGQVVRIASFECPDGGEARGGSRPATAGVVRRDRDSGGSREKTAII